MANYPNTLGLLVASELVNNDATLSAVPVIKSAVRDLKRYMKLKSEAIQQRVLPIGYDAAMNGARDMTILRYLVGGGIENSIDFWTVRGKHRNLDVVEANVLTSVTITRGLENQVWHILDMMLWCVRTIYIHSPTLPLIC